MRESPYKIDKRKSSFSNYQKNKSNIFISMKNAVIFIALGHSIVCNPIFMIDWKHKEDKGCKLSQKD